MLPAPRRIDTGPICATEQSLPVLRRACGHPRTCQAASAVSEVASSSQLGEGLRGDFPILHQSVSDKPLVYLDNAATSQKPLAVTDTLTAYYTGYNANVHRGVHTLSARATSAYEDARLKVARLINASDRDIVFTRNATEAINLVAYSWAMANLTEGDEILVSVAEHHSNLVPWQLVAAETGAVLRHASLTPATEEVDMADLTSKITPKTRLVALAHVSNALGYTLPVADVVEEAQAVGAKVLLDCCQSVPHMPVDVGSLGVDWIVASGHKMCGPTGIGFLWGKAEVLESMQPWMGGGEMIQDVYLDHSTYAPPPGRFEAGTPAIGEAIGLGAAAEYLMSLGMDSVHAFEQEIGGYLHQELSAVEGLRIYGPPPEAPGGRASLCAFNVAGVNCQDLSMLMDTMGVAIRSGHHCTQPLHRYLDVLGSARASLYIYNTPGEVDVCVEALRESIKFLS